MFLPDFLDRNCLMIVVAATAQKVFESVQASSPSVQFRCLRGFGAEYFAFASAPPRPTEGALKRAVYAVVLAR